MQHSDIFQYLTQEKMTYVLSMAKFDNSRGATDCIISILIAVSKVNFSLRFALVDSTVSVVSCKVCHVAEMGD